MSPSTIVTGGVTVGGLESSSVPVLAFDSLSSPTIDVLSIADHAEATMNSDAGFTEEAVLTSIGPGVIPSTDSATGFHDKADPSFTRDTTVSSKGMPPLLNVAIASWHLTSAIPSPTVVSIAPDCGDNVRAECASGQPEVSPDSVSPASPATLYGPNCYRPY